MLSTVTPQTADNVMVQGVAALNGHLSVTLTGGPFTVGTQYTLLQASGGLNGTTFTNVSITAPPGVKSQVTYDANHVYLIINASGTTRRLLPQQPPQPHHHQRLHPHHPQRPAKADAHRRQDRVRLRHRVRSRDFASGLRLTSCSCFPPNVSMEAELDSTLPG